MQHIATPEFYAAADALVGQAREAGYAHFYEFIDLYALTDTEQRKVRKLTQFLPMPDVYSRLAAGLEAQLGLALVAQNADGSVSLTAEGDTNADVAPQEFLRPAEAAVGKIELSGEDLHTPLSDPVSVGIPPEQWMPVVIDARNAHPAHCVHVARDPRIVITYGAAHEPGWFAALRDLDPR